jgi:predicted permease
MNRNDLFLRLRALFAWRRVENELDEELRFHLEMQTRKNLAAGMRPDDAARHARIQFGGVAQAQEECRDARRIGFFETLFQDVRYAFRGFRRSPGFAFTVIATVALGLGLNTSLFTAFNAYVLRPLAVRDPYSLYRYTWINRNGDGHMFSWREFQELRSQNPAFSEIMAVHQLGFARAEGHIMFGQLVTGNYFSMLGIEAALGRTLYPEDAAAPGSAPVVVLSFKTWRNKFAGDPDIVGKKIFIHGYPLQVVGVAHAGFTGLSEVPLDFWAPLTMAAQLEPGPSLFALQQPERLNIIGRLRRELSPRQAAAAITAWAQQTTAGRPNPEKATGIILRSEATTIPLDPIVIAAFSPIIVAFGLVLLISCANVANMMLARAMARQREIGIRLAIGAARGRLIRQLLTESVLLALPAAVAGFGISYATIEWVIRLIFATLPRGYADFISILPLQPDIRVFAFMLMAAVLSALLFGLAPAVQATRSNVMQAARGEFTTDFRPARLRNALVVGQVSVSVLLLICAAVLLRANNRIESLDVGLKPRGVVAMTIQDRLRSRVLQHLATDPLIESVAAASKKPFEGSLASLSVVPEGASERFRVGYMYASPEYLPIFGQSLLRGRNFSADEAESAAPVAVVSKATAERLWPGRDAIGKSLRIDPPARRPRDLSEYAAGAPPYATARIIGIARDVVNGYVGYGIDETCIYFPSNLRSAGADLFVRVKGDAEAAQRKLDLALATSVPGAIDDIHTMDEILSAQIYPYRAVYWIASALGTLALLLTLSGIYGVQSYLVTQRTREIGIRVALGASTRSVAGLVLRQSLWYALIGATIGTIAAAGASRVLASLADMPMFDSIDTAAFAMGSVLVVACSACAAWFPSRRAARIEPITTLRYD